MDDLINKLRDQLRSESRLVLSIKAQPASARTEIKEIFDDGTIKTSIAAPPVQGKANKELIKFLAQLFGVSRENVRIIKGQWSRAKQIEITI